MKKKKLLARIEELERKLADAEARIAWLEARPIVPVTVPTDPDPHFWRPPCPHWPEPYIGDPIPQPYTTITWGNDSGLWADGGPVTIAS